MSTAEDESKPTCSNCRYWELSLELKGGVSAGICRRYPPTILPPQDGEDHNRSLFPETGNFDWCGEHEDP